MRISNEDFDKAQRGGNDGGGRRRVPGSAVQCDGCGSRSVVVRNSRSQRYYRCSAATKGHPRYAACRTLMRMPD